jgi:hypothetical protein
LEHRQQNLHLMKKRRKQSVRAKLVPLGVDIIDRNGEMLAAITEEEAVHLVASLLKQMPRILRRLPSNDESLSERKIAYEIQIPVRMV